ncbi:YbaB/EbfC family nucleoid-associated protein [Saccharothrix variisporea]|uniref:DNA-binding protein YbaB n=1 Tax=Saccharothrix variisporea TaxID=543527 RepID=A0A495XCB4_9PSEU|nr:YbaB/EbfC family nucleoid-associated protein [Saccharothrix variisporea]RKT71289.1 DNA-binding protein YbaB [Saccharothrix variisporea]
MSALEDMAARADRREQAREALKRELAGRVVAGRDGSGLVEVGVDTSGKVVEVAVNATLVARVDPKVLANAILEAATTAQRSARDLVAERRSYYLGS